MAISPEKALGRTVDLHDVPVRVEQVELRKTGQPLPKHEKPHRVSLLGVLAKAESDEVIEDPVEVARVEREMRVVVVDRSGLAERALRIMDQVDLDQEEELLI